MSPKTWNIGSISVGGSAMVGDGNRMVIHTHQTVTLTPEQRQQAGALADELKTSITQLPQGSAQSLSPADHTALLQALNELRAALEKKEQPVETSFLKRSLETISKVLEHTPAALAIAGKLTSILGF